jgi:predicted RNase H-related nuclease YkuK (DUF458 family)
LEISYVAFVGADGSNPQRIKQVFPATRHHRIDHGGHGCCSNKKTFRITAKNYDVNPLRKP